MSEFRAECRVPGQAEAPVFVVLPRETGAGIGITPEAGQGDPTAQWNRFYAALEPCGRRLAQLKQQALQQSGPDEAAVFDAQHAMLLDGDFHEAVHEQVFSHGASAERAVVEASEEIAALLLSLSDEILRSKSADIREVGSLMFRVLTGTETILPEGPCVVLADSLLPGQLVEMGRDNVKGVVVHHASAQSHVVVLAAGMAIPLMVCPDIPIDASLQGLTARLDSDRSTVTLGATPGPAGGRTTPNQAAPTSHSADNFRYKRRRIHLYANVSSVEEIPVALAHQATGIGLFRTEFQYMGRRQAPTEDELFDDYRRAVEALGGRYPLTLRTADIGSDKSVNYLHQGLKETNPALGCRGIRFSLQQPDLFRTQLKAVLRAAAIGPVRLMLPMVSRIEEVEQAWKMLESCRRELQDKGIPHALPLTGVMIETPAAALNSAFIADHSRFLSIGSNDLTQYTLALDRENETLAQPDGLDPAVLSLIRMSAQSARKSRIPIGICGEAAHDPAALKDLLQAGIDYVSVAPAYLDQVRQQLLELCNK